ncbi:MAG: competence protein ComEC [Parcubacteria group bacterium LiPW_39]|nr:MAG: competence protein ComEC [Parcubacteria group bacterium LiPW_39]
MLGGLCLAAFFIWLAVFELGSSEQLKIIFFDVGQGSAVLIEASNNNQVLIDGGPSDAILAKLGKELPLFDRQIELVILTHPDSDHLSGLIEVLKRYEVGEILETGIADSSAEYQTWNNLMAAKKIPVVFARAGQIIKIADGLALKILYPLGPIAGQDFSKNTNASSIVGKLFYGKNTVLFTGDAEFNTEWPLLASGVNLKADILQVGHHGSKNSTSEKFLAAVVPKIAVIQVGAKNRYGHPHQELLDRLKNINIFRTDLGGNIVFSCDLQKCWAGK